MNKPFKTVPMYGPCLRDPKKMVNRDIPEADVRAYKAAGYKLGSIEVEPEPVEVIVETPKAAVDVAKVKGRKK